MLESLKLSEVWSNDFVERRKYGSGCTLHFINIMRLTTGIGYSRGTALRAVWKGQSPFFLELPGPPLRARGPPLRARGPPFSEI